jgi:catechol 2,3-dioxygenase-like lactoylglutathione lyase family enzyme
MSPALRVQDLFHTGIVVPDLEAGAAALTEAAGYRWTKVQTAEMPLRFPDGDRVLRIRYAYSLDDPTLELVEELPGTPFASAGGRSIHHLGYFSDDVPGTVAALVAEGWELEVHAVVNGELAIFAFLVDPTGMRVELIDRARIPDLAAYKRERS